MNKILAVDYGKSKTGIAISDPLKILARDYEVIFDKNPYRVVERIGEICQKEKVELILLGMPLSLDGQKWDSAIRVEKFQEKLAVLEIPIKQVDERYSTKIAEERMREQNESQEKIYNRADAVAASVFLQDYLDFL